MILSTIAASQMGGGTLEEAATADPGQLSAGFANAFRAAAGIALAGALLARVALRLSDVAPGAQSAFGH